MCWFKLKRMPSRKTHGGYATIEKGPRGTLLKFIGVNTPIAIEAANEEFVLDTTQLVNDIKTKGIDISQIRNAVKYPAGFLNNKYASKTINGVISMNSVLNTWIHQNGNCDLDRAMTAIHGKEIDLTGIRNFIRTYVGGTADFIALSLNTAYQGNIFGNDSVSKRLIAYSPGLDTHIPNYRRPVNTTHPRIPADPFIAMVLNNNMFRGWYGSINSRVNPQYVRFIDDSSTTGPLILGLNGPDGAVSKDPKDEMADIIPAGTVRSTIMLLIRAFLNQYRETLIPDDTAKNALYAAISYITLLAGLANAYGDTTHIKEYNGSIGDRYGRDAHAL